MRTRFTRGLTLIETIIWVAVFTMAMAAMVQSLLSFYRANTYTLEQAQAVSDARRAIERVVQVMREADYGSDGAYPIVSMSTTSITFYADIDQDPQVERVRYFIASTTLSRGVVEPTGDPVAYTAGETISPVASFIRNIEQGIVAFTYYDAAGAVVNDLARVRDVRFIRMNAVVNVSPARLPNELTLRSSATLRNLKESL